MNSYRLPGAGRAQEEFKVGDLKGTGRDRRSTYRLIDFIVLDKSHSSRAVAKPPSPSLRGSNVRLHIYLNIYIL